jgi:hypothetical protein
MRLSAKVASTKCAFVNAAISASVDEGCCLKKFGCAIPPAAVRLAVKLRTKYRRRI